jgi:hypothetical protein
MKTYYNGCKCSKQEMAKIKEEQRQMSIGCRERHSPEVNQICSREIQRWLELQSFGVWENVEYIYNAVQDDLGFYDRVIETQLKNLVKHKIIEKRFLYWKNTRQILGAQYRASTVISDRRFCRKGGDHEKIQKRG